MEQNETTAPLVDTKPKTGIGLKITTAIMSILAVCGIGFGVYSIMQLSEKDNEISSLKTQINNSSNSSSSNNNSTSDETSSVVTDQYKIFADNLAKNYAVTTFGYYYHWTGSDNVRRTVAARVENSHLTLTDIDNGDTVIAEADGIISVYYVEIGNGGVPYMYLIKKDGSVARINLYAPMEIENLDGYNKIVSIFRGNDLAAYLVDINGNVYQNV